MGIANSDQTHRVVLTSEGELINGKDVQQVVQNRMAYGSYMIAAIDIGEAALSFFVNSKYIGPIALDSRIQ